MPAAKQSKIVYKDHQNNLSITLASVLSTMSNVRIADKAEHELHLLQRVVSQLSDIVIIAETVPSDPFDATIVYANEAFSELSGQSVAVILGQPLRMLLAAETNQEIRSEIHQALQEHWPLRTELPGPGTRGRHQWLELDISPIIDDSGYCTHYVAVIRDISQRKRMEEELLREKERAEITLHSIGDAVITTDGDGLVDYLNPVAEELTGWSLAEAHGTPLVMVFPVIDEQDRQPAGDLVSRCLVLEPPATLSEHHLLLNRQAQEYAVKISVTPLSDRLGTVLTFQDVTSERRAVREISYNATHDALTGLINRREFEQRLQRVLHDTREQPALHVLCYMDLDRFKQVNDTCGHLAGDELLRQVSELLQSNSRKRDTLARLGGDEFALLMEHCPLDQAQRVAEQVRAALEAFHFSWDSHGFTIGVSIGLVEISATSGNLPEVLKQADTACYIAKDSGRNRIHIYQPDTTSPGQQNGPIQEAATIRQALTQGPFQLYAQTIADIGLHDHTRSVAGVSYEVLTRLQPASGKQIQPGTFIPVAERYNLGAELDCRVIEQTCRQLTARPEHLPRLALCMINLCAQSLQDEKVFALLHETLQRYAIPPAKICFEIKETTAITHLSSATRFIDKVKTLGCLFALDNFGSGLSSFSYLKNLPVDFLKIDGRFIKRITDDPIDLAMVMAINQIGHVMAKKMIAEHVESEAVLQRLKSFGVDYAQGFYLGRPVPLEEMTQISYKA